MPLVSKRNADFLHFEVPGITLPEEIREREWMDMKRKRQRIEEGIRISQELVDAADEIF